MIEAMKARGAEVPIPVDVVTAKTFAADAPATVKPVADVADDDLILDIGPQTRRVAGRELQSAGTIVWNGPVGVFEFDAFAHGTETIARAIAGSPAFSIAGGGDTLAAIAKYGIEKEIGYISTGGGAFLEVLEGKTLPAFEILERRARDNPVLSCMERFDRVPRATKIVATLGPASSDARDARADDPRRRQRVRLNFTHGKAQDHIDRADPGARGRGQGRQGSRDHGRPAGTEDPRRQVRRRQDDARAPARSSCSTPRDRAGRPARASASTTRSCRAT